MENLYIVIIIIWCIVIINLLIIFYPITLVPLKNMIMIRKKSVKAYMSDGSLEREINLNYSPALISLLLDGKVELIKDLLADVLNLIYKKVIKVEKDNNIFQIDYSKLKETKISRDEHCIIKYIERKLKGTDINFEKFEKSVKLEFIENGFDIEDKSERFFKGIPKALMYAFKNWNILLLMFSLPLALIFTIPCIVQAFLNLIPIKHWIITIFFEIITWIRNFSINDLYCSWWF